MKKILIPIGAILLSNVAYGQLSATENYIQSKTYTDYPSGQSPKIEETVQYLDGFGREKQIINVKSTPLQKDLVTKVPYDEFGRKVDTWFPVPMNSLNGAIQSGVESQASAFYGDSFPFSHTEVEKSALDRIKSKTMPGTDWQPHSSQYIHDINSNPDHVRKLITTTTWPDNATKSIVRTSDSGAYAAGSLSKVQITDEDGNVTVEFKNGFGQTVLQRRILSATENADTYYVYNEYNQMAFIIPPNATVKFFDELSASADEEIPLQVLNSLCYQYRYDNRNRLVEKRQPGKGWEYMVYDKQDRLVLTQDANLGSQKKWLFTKYDHFGRVVYTGIYTSTQPYSSTGRAAEQATLDTKGSNNTYRTPTNSTVGFTSSGDMNVYYLSNMGYPETFSTLLTLNYYDSYPLYSFNPPLPPNALKDNPFLKSISTHGLPVMTFVKNIEDDLWTKNYTFYDNKARPIGTYSINHLGGFTKTEIDLNFSGMPTQLITKHKILDTATEKVITENFNYDSQNRPVKHTHKVDNNPTEILSQNTYNEILQISNKKVGGENEINPLQSVDYSYDLHGALKGINNVNNLNNKLFAYSIKYQNPEDAGNQAKFNGGISEIDWRTSFDDVKRRYGFQYDKLGRLLNATYGKPILTTTPGEHYNESVTYDISGNIKTLLRFGGRDFGNKMRIDDINYTYDGNRLIEVWDSSGNYLGLDGGDGIEYDENGNMTADYAHYIYDIKYNHLNLPNNFDRFQGPLTYTYSADGKKLSSFSILSETNEMFGKNYLDGFQYENGILQFVPTSEGYFDFTKNKYIYNYTDHLGNIRISFAKSSAGTGLEVVKENNYYPFGLKHQGYNNINASNNYNYMFNGKELEENGNYDFGARFYMPDIARWGAYDPLSEEYTQWSPYNYTMNNPISYIDPDGRGVSSTGVRDNNNGTYTVVNAKNDGDTGVYIADSRGNYDINSSEKIAETHLPTEFMQANNVNGKFEGHINTTFTLNPLYDIRIDGKWHRSLNGNDIKTIYMALFKEKTKGMWWVPSLTFLRDNSGNKKKFDIKASIKGLSPENVVMLDGKLTTMRGLGNEIFGANMDQVADKAYGMGISKDFFYHQVMPQVGDYNQSQNKGTGYNKGWPFFGEHTFSGSYIFHGFYGRFPYRTDIKY